MKNRKQVKPAQTVCQTLLVIGEGHCSCHIQTPLPQPRLSASVDRCGPAPNPTSLARKVRDEILTCRGVHRPRTLTTAARARSRELCFLQQLIHRFPVFPVGAGVVVEECRMDTDPGLKGSSVFGRQQGRLAEHLHCFAGPTSGLGFSPGQQKACETCLQVAPPGIHLTKF